MTRALLIGTNGVAELNMSVFNQNKLIHCHGCTHTIAPQVADLGLPSLGNGDTFDLVVGHY